MCNIYVLIWNSVIYVNFFPIYFSYFTNITFCIKKKRWPVKEGKACQLQQPHQYKSPLFSTKGGAAEHSETVFSKISCKPQRSNLNLLNCIRYVTF